MKLYPIFTFLFISSLCFATTWRVNNNDPTADFSDTQLAHDDTLVHSGDVLMIEGSETYYSNLTCTKQLNIIGPGYYLMENFTTANHHSAKMNWVQFESGSEGSSVYGMYFNQGVQVHTDDINVERCFINGAVQIGSLTSTINNTRVIGNMLGSITNFYSGQRTFINAIVNNNIFTFKTTISYNCSIITFDNNILVSGESYSFSTEYFRNNIIVNEPIMNIKAGYSNNNIALADVLTGVENKVVDNTAELFKGGDSPDGKYLLSENSAAIGAGFDGSDCGIFGGSTPYIISGIPPIPTILELQVESTTTHDEGLGVKIRVSNN